MGPIRCPETSAMNYHYTPRNSSEERSSQRQTCLTFINSKLCPHRIFVYFIWHSEQALNSSYRALNEWFLQPRRDVYCALRTGY
jgi:hypothetical protein